MKIDSSLGIKINKLASPFKERVFYLYFIYFLFVFYLFFIYILFIFLCICFLFIYNKKENIEAYINGCKKLGMKEVDLFVTVDLYEGQNMTQVVDNLMALGGVAQKVNPKLPAIGIKYSEENVNHIKSN